MAERALLSLQCRSWRSKSRRAQLIGNEVLLKRLFRSTRQPQSASKEQDFVQSLPSRDEPRPSIRKTLLLCTDERTGSHLLAERMATTGVLGRPCEYFNTVSMRFLYPDYPNDVSEQLRLAIALSTTPNGVFALKLHFQQASPIFAQLNFQNEQFGELYFVHLIREDMLGQAISLVKARQTGLWASSRTKLNKDCEWEAPSARPHEAEGLSYDGSAIKATLEDLVDRRAGWDLYFARNGISPLRLTYEQLVKEPLETVSSIARHSNIDDHVALNKRQWYRFDKQSNYINDDWRDLFLAEHKDFARLSFEDEDLNQGLAHPDEGSPTARDLATYWAIDANYDPEWDGRGQLAVGFLKQSEGIFSDIGCGARFALRRFLPHGSTYYPADLKQWNSEVSECDLNAGIVPVDILKASDVTFLLGVCEYLYDVPAAISLLYSYCPVLIVSYCTTDGPYERWNMWVNAFSEVEFKSLLSEAGYRVEQQLAYKPGQFIFRAVRS